jgi:hypothetical protein
MTDLNEALKPESPKLDAERVREVLRGAGWPESRYNGWIRENAGWDVSLAGVGEIGYESFMVEYKPEHSYGPIGPTYNKDEWEKSIAVEAEILTRYQEVLEAAGLNVTRLNRTTNGRQAWLVVE